VAIALAGAVSLLLIGAFGHLVREWRLVGEVSTTTRSAPAAPAPPVLAPVAVPVSETAKPPVSETAKPETAKPERPRAKPHRTRHRPRRPIHPDATIDPFR
jgi:hypothetical protein